jgi:hypothetical protein
MRIHQKNNSNPRELQEYSIEFCKGNTVFRVIRILN